jgi:hypothetical protein
MCVCVVANTVNVMTLMLAVLDEVVDGMNISLAGVSAVCRITLLAECGTRILGSDSYVSQRESECKRRVRGVTALLLCVCASAPTWSSAQSLCVHTPTRFDTSSCLPARLPLCCLTLQHNVRLQLTYLDVAPEGEAPASRQAQKTEMLLQQALQPPKTHTASH